VWALQVLRGAGPGKLPRLNAGARRNLEAARAMMPEQRLVLLDALLLRRQALRPQQPDLEPIRYSDIRM